MIRAAPQDHPCHVPGCRDLACYGYTRPGGLRERKDGDVTVWACAAHRDAARARAAELMGYALASPADRPKADRAVRERPAQGSFAP